MNNASDRSLMSSNGVNFNNIGNSQEATIRSGSQQQRIKQTEQNTNYVEKLKSSPNLASRYVDFSKMIAKKTENTFWNSIKNFFVRGRETSLNAIKTQLTHFEQGEAFDFSNLNLNMQGLSSEVKNALEDLRIHIFTQEPLKGDSNLEKKSSETTHKTDDVSQNETKISNSNNPAEERKISNKEENNPPERQPYVKSNNPNNIPPEEQKIYTQEDFIEMFKNITENGNCQVLGEGTFGEVYGNKDFVFKVMKDNGAASKEINANRYILEGKKGFRENKEVLYKESEGFFTEYKTSFNLKDDRKVLVFERVKGLDLFEYMNEPENFAGNKSVADAHKEALNSLNVKFRTDCVIFSQMAMGIAALHETGCVNRDIKPENTMICFRSKTGPVEDSVFVKTIDQGFTVDLKEGKNKFELAGTPLYVPPEVWEAYDNPQPIPAHDVYAFGMTLAGNFTKSNFLTPLYCSKTPWDDIGKIQNLKSEDISGKVPDGAKDFMCCLIKSCVALNPKDRITAAQASALLQILYSAVEKDPSVQLTKKDFDEALKLVCEARPKSIPLAMREMLASNDPETQEKGCAAILALGHNDPSYQATPSYGLALLRSENTTSFKEWGQKNPNILKDLKGRIFTKEENQYEMRTVKTKNKNGKVIERSYHVLVRDMQVKKGEKEVINNLDT